MTKLNKTQLALLTTAGGRSDGSLVPASETLISRPALIRKSLQGLLEQGLATEVQARAPDAAWREEGDCRIGLIINNAGRAAIGLSELAPGGGATGGSENEAATAPKLRFKTKQALLLELIGGDEGATIEQIVAATGWLPHTSRAAISGLRKRGNSISLENVNGVSRYRCKAAPLPGQEPQG